MVLLDGDQRVEVRRKAEVPDDEVLDELAKLGIEKGHLGLSGGDADNTAEAIERGKAILEWAETYIAYLPDNEPEQLLLEWAGETATGTAKEHWVGVARTELGWREDEDPPAQDILGTQKRVIARVDPDDARMTAVRDAVVSYVEAVGA